MNCHINIRHKCIVKSSCLIIVWASSQKEGRTKNKIMISPLHGKLRLINSPTVEQIQNGRRQVKLQEPNYPLMRPRIVLSHCFHCGYFCAENFVFFFTEIKLLLTYFLRYWWMKLFLYWIKWFPEFNCVPCWIWLIEDNAIAPICDFAWL